jgi:hypothetical protein
MTFRVLLVVGAVAFASALPARAQKPGSFEVGAFVAYLNADNSLPMRNAIGFGGRVGVNTSPFLSFEVDVASASKDGVRHRPLHVWLLYDAPLVRRAEMFLGVGLVSNTYTGTYTGTDSGIAAQVGVRHRVGRTLAVRVDGHADFMPSSANKSYPVSYNGNWGVGIGFSALLNR